jgi:sugar phosphate isomerase/epimerase
VLLWPALRAFDAEARCSELHSAAARGPDINFPAQAHERIAIASYPFRDFIAGAKEITAGANNAGIKKIGLRDFAAHTSEKLNVKKVEPWSEHFLSRDRRYLEDVRNGVEKSGGAIVNIAVDGEYSPYATDRAEREAFLRFDKEWVDVAAVVGSPSIRTNISKAKDSEPDVERAANSLSRVAEYAASKNIVVNLENDNPVSEDPFFVVQVIERVGSAWLHALPDFANTLTTGGEEHAYQGMSAMFPHAYNICHVKEMETSGSGKDFHVDMHKTFGILKNAHYKGYFSMEFDSAGDPYQGIAQLIETTLRELS